MGYENDWEDDQQESYNETYVSKIAELTKGQDADTREVTLNELAKLRYNRSENGALDAEVNFLKAEKAAAKTSRFEPSVESYIRFKAREQGTNLQQARQWARKQLKNSD